MHHSAFPFLGFFTRALGRKVLRLAALGVLELSLCAPLSHGAVFQVSPASVPVDFGGTVELKIGQLPPGASVRVEKFLDKNGDGQVQASDPLLESYVVTDGVVPAIHGIRDSVIHSDADGLTNSAVSIRLDFSQTTELDRISGQFVYRVSDPAGKFTAVEQPFIVTSTPLPQGITGVVKDRVTGDPIASAQVGLWNVDTSQLVASVFNDASGRFTAYCQPGHYLLLPLRRGYIYSLQADLASLENATIAVPPGQFVTSDPSLEHGVVTISGLLQDAGSGAGIPGIAVYALSAEQGDNGEISSLSFTFGLTDPKGQFSVQGRKGNWGFTALPQQLARAGYLAPADLIFISATNDLGTNITISLPKATALVYGQLKNSAGKPLPGVQVQAIDSDQELQSLASTDANGFYTLGIAAGNWSVGPTSSTLDPLGYQAPDEAQFRVDDGTATEQGFSLVPVVPSLAVVGFVASGGFQVQLTGESGRTFQVESSPDLRTWSKQAPVTISRSPQVYTDPQATPNSTRFYRVVE